MPTDPRGSTLLRTVCLDPDDVGARLVYADWLEQEGGAPERGEFIRVQCELADIAEKANHQGKYLAWSCKCEWCEAAKPLRRRERELLAAPAPGGWNPNPGNGYHWSGPAFWHAGTDVRWSFRRGFVEAVACTAEQWERHGPALVLAQPVLSVRLVGREPLWVGISQGYYHEKPWTWLGPGAANDPRPKYRTASLPQSIYDLCSGWYPTEQAALDALSRACVAWARRQAGLDVPCVECWDFLKCSRKPGWAACPDCKGAGWVTAR